MAIPTAAFNKYPGFSNHQSIPDLAQFLPQSRSMTEAKRKIGNGPETRMKNKLELVQSLVRWLGTRPSHSCSS